MDMAVRYQQMDALDETGAAERAELYRLNPEELGGAGQTVQTGSLELSDTGHRGRKD